jgi:hypothetical protein
MFLVGIPGYRGDGPLFWLEPVVMLVGGAPVWRMGSLLRARARGPTYAEFGYRQYLIPQLPTQGYNAIEFVTPLHASSSKPRQQ